MEEQHNNENVLPELAEWLKTLATTLDVQSAARHLTSSLSSPWWAVQLRVGRFKLWWVVLNLRWVF